MGANHVVFGVRNRGIFQRPALPKAGLTSTLWECMKQPSSVVYGLHPTLDHASCVHPTPQVDSQSWRPEPRGAPAPVGGPVEAPSFPTLPPPSLDTSTDSVFSSSSSHVPPPPPPALSTSSTSSSLWATATDYTDQSDSTLVSSVVQPRHMNGGGGDREETQGGTEDTRLPPTQSPYITLLQKSRGQLRLVSRHHFVGLLVYCDLLSTVIMIFVQ